MKKAIITTLTIVIYLAMAIKVAASQEPGEHLILDTHVVNSEVINFPNDDEIYPDKSDFKIIHLVTMSNELGERWATVTINNQSAGRRVFKPAHIMALFADGSRRAPIHKESVFDGHESISMTLFFGQNKFPILSIMTRQ